MDRFDVAQICLNGHVITARAKTQPQLTRQFCDRCGAPTLTTCQNCDANIPGGYLRERIGVPFSAPAFCSNCGVPYPWTEKGLGAARELVSELEGLTEDEKALLGKDLNDIVADTPRTTVAATRWKKALSKASKELAPALREILIEIASETAKKQLGL